MTAKRCICRKSARYPLCDGTHTEQSWCRPSFSSDISKLVLCSPSLTPLSEWWATQAQASLFRELSQSSEHNVDEIWILSDGVDVDILRILLRQIPHRTEHWVHVNGSPFLPNKLSNRGNIQVTHYTLPEEIDIEQFSISSLVPCSVEAPVNQKVFISHSVQDEHFLLPILDTLQELYELDMFTCATIPQGTEWYPTIESNLRNSDAVWAFCSESFSRSTFCAFEMGLARGLNTPIHIISIDDAPPPAHLQHQNMASAIRTQSQTPWLSLAQSVQMLCQRLLFVDDGR